MEKAQNLSVQNVMSNQSGHSTAFKTFLKKAWEKGLDLAENLMKYATSHSKNKQANLQQKKPQNISDDSNSTQTKSLTDPNGLQNIQSAKGKVQSSNLQNDQNQPSQFLKDFPKDVKKSNNFLTQQFPSKKTEYEVKIMVIPDKAGRVNVQQLLKRLQNLKQDKIQKQKLKISRNEFNFIDSPSFNKQEGNKSLFDLFKSKQKSLLKQNSLQKNKNLQEYNEQKLKKTPVKGFTQMGDQKMINQNSPSPIVFRGDLSTILQSSTQQISIQKKDQKNSILQNKDNELGTISIPQKKYQQSQKQQKTLRKYNPFLDTVKQDSTLKSNEKETKNNSIQSMRIKLFSSPFDSNFVQTNQVFDVTSKTQKETSSNQLNGFLGSTVLKNFQSFQQPQPLNQTINNFNAQNPSYPTVCLMNKPSLNTLPTFKKDQLLKDEKNKKIFDSFVQPLPLNGNFSNSKSSYQGTSLFGSIVESEMDRKTERKGRMESKKRGKKQQRIRG